MFCNWKIQSSYTPRLKSQKLQIRNILYQIIQRIINLPVLKHLWCWSLETFCQYWGKFFLCPYPPSWQKHLLFCTWQKWAFQIKGNYNKSIFYYFQSIQVFIHPSADSGTTRKCLEFCECYTSLTCMHAEAKTKEKKVFSSAG